MEEEGAGTALPERETEEGEDSPGKGTPTRLSFLRAILVLGMIFGLSWPLYNWLVTDVHTSGTLVISAGSFKADQNLQLTVGNFQDLSLNGFKGSFSPVELKGRRTDLAFTPYGPGSIVEIPEEMGGPLAITASGLLELSVDRADDQTATVHCLVVQGKEDLLPGKISSSLTIAKRFSVQWSNTTASRPDTKGELPVADVQTIGVPADTTQLTCYTDARSEPRRVSVTLGSKATIDAADAIDRVPTDVQFKHVASCSLESDEYFTSNIAEADDVTVRIKRLAKKPKVELQRDKGMFRVTLEGELESVNKGSLQMLPNLLQKTFTAKPGQQSIRGFILVFLALVAAVLVKRALEVISKILIPEAKED